MTIQDSQKNLQSLLDACVSKGSIFGNTNEVMAMQASLNLLVENINNITAENAQLKKLLPEPTKVIDLNNKDDVNIKNN